jgi:hypothetical protein
MIKAMAVPTQGMAQQAKQAMNKILAIHSFPNAGLLRLFFELAL